MTISTALQAKGTTVTTLPAATFDYFQDVDQVPLNAKCDVFALSMASYRRWAVDNEPRWLEIFDQTPTEEDTRLAEAMKAHFRDKIMLKALKGKVQKEYDQELYDLIVGNTQPLRKHMGMLCRLPYQYAEDLDREALWSQVNKTIHPKTEMFETWTLRPLKSILRSRKRQEVMEFWYTNELNEPVVWNSPLNNACHLMLLGISKWPGVRLRAIYQPMLNQSTQNAYWSVTSPSLDDVHSDSHVA